ncbi:restriction endonuclease subunit S [Gluconobacter oxydans]|uniref:restriction endonuclease subunit S n=1 Tax=Gluconobacter oxydans TaxID=442 RepID=UPI0039EB375E
MMLPQGWIETQLEVICHSINYGCTSTSDAKRGDIRYIRITDIQDNDVEWSNVPYLVTPPKDIEKYELNKGDLVFARTGATVGKSHLFVALPYRSVFASYLIRVRCNEKFLCPIYAKWFFQSPQYWKQINDGAEGTGQPNFNGTKLAHLVVPLPPLAEQRRIVAKLDSLTARIARARAELKRVVEASPSAKRTVLRSGVLGELTETWRSHVAQENIESILKRIPIPKQGRGGRTATDKVIHGAAALSVNKPDIKLPDGWGWVPLLRLARQETGHTPSRSKPEYWDGDISWIGIRDAGTHHGRRIDHTLQTITNAGLANSSARLLPAGTVCLSRTASVGYVTIMNKPMATSQDFATWTCSDALIPEFLMFALMAEGQDIRKFGMGSTHTTIYFPEIRALHIALPPVTEQIEIVRRIHSDLSRLDRLETEAQRALTLIDRLESSLLAKAFRGELVPQDPNDEPASVLLNRIRTERAADTKPKRGRKQSTQDMPVPKKRQT